MHWGTATGPSGTFVGPYRSRLSIGLFGRVLRAATRRHTRPLDSQSHPRGRAACGGLVPIAVPGRGARPGRRPGRRAGPVGAPPAAHRDPTIQLFTMTIRAGGRGANRPKATTQARTGPRPAGRRADRTARDRRGPVAAHRTGYAGGRSRPFNYIRLYTTPRTYAVCIQLSQWQAVPSTTVLYYIYTDSDTAARTAHTTTPCRVPSHTHV